MLRLFADDYHPTEVNHIDDRITCYGYLCTCPGEKELSGDIRSYAMQNTEVSNNLSFMMGKLKIKATIVRSFQDRLYVGFTREFISRLRSTIKGSMSIAVNVSFVLKRSYFNRLRKSVQRISSTIISRLFPSLSDFHPIRCRLQINKPNESNLQLDTVGQMQALTAILGSLPSDPPILISGSFGTGKTRLLIRAAHDILCQDPTSRILLCAYQNSSADVLTHQFLKSANEWINAVFRFVGERYVYKSEIAHKFFVTCRSLDKTPFRLLITTFSTASSLPQIHFTHIFMDEGAQTREPEAIIPLCLAANDTKIVIAGDHCQVCELQTRTDVHAYVNVYNITYDWQ